MHSQDLIMALLILLIFRAKSRCKTRAYQPAISNTLQRGRGHKPFGVTFRSKWVLRGSDMRIRGKSPRPILPKMKVVPPANLTTAVHIHIIETKISWNDYLQGKL